MIIVEYLAQEGFLGDDFNRLMYDCAMQGDIDALQIFLNCRPEYFTVVISLKTLSFSSRNLLSLISWSKLQTLTSLNFSPLPHQGFHQHHTLLVETFLKPKSHGLPTTVVMRIPVLHQAQINGTNSTRK
jgi:hypothetical protein